MSHSIACYRCGASLGGLSLPFTRKDQCPACFTELHVCRMCIHYDPTVPQQCREDDAEEVKEKGLANFCEWYSPSETAFNPQGKTREQQAREALEALFSGLKDKN